MSVVHTELVASGTNSGGISGVIRGPSYSMIDTTFDFRTDAGGRDPDTYSPTLRRYRRLLWSKALPSGLPFVLDHTTDGVYLHHQSALGDFFLASDSVIATFTGYIVMQPIVNQSSEEENEAFLTIAYTVGGMLIFPGNRIGRKLTINGARGFNPRIAGRLDLTLECIRRHYRSEWSPLAVVLARYHDFFALFGDFRGYVEFFLLQDLVAAAQVLFFTPFDDFVSSALPTSPSAYRDYRRRSIEFVEARNDRINRWAASHWRSR